MSDITIIEVKYKKKIYYVRSPQILDLNITRIDGVVPI